MANKEDSLKPIRPKPRIEGVNPSSTLPLKAQVVRRHQELAPYLGGHGDGVPLEHRRGAGVNLRELRDVIEQQANPGVEARAARADDAPESQVAFNVQTYKERLAYSANKLRAKEQLYNDYVQGKVDAPDDYVVNFEGRTPGPGASSPQHSPERRYALRSGGAPPNGRPRRPHASDPPGGEARRASPSYEPYAGRAEPRRTDHDAHAAEAPAGFQFGGELGQDDEEWRWGKGDEEQRQLIDAEHRERKFRERQARDRAMDERVAALKADEAREKQQRTEKRQAEVAIVQELAAEAADRKAAQTSAATKSASVKRALLDRLVESKLKRAKAARKAAPPQAAPD